jgi:uncharacterized membrane protein YuzA (DUF378 family)
MKEMSLYCWIAYIAVLVGGINLGLMGLFGFSLITAILGNLLGRLIYVAIGVGAGYLCYGLYLDKFKKSA